MGSSARGAGVGSQVRMLLYVAMVLFCVTIGIGILNGLDVVEFNHDQLLTHVHSGTLGWVTLCLVAASFWMFGGGDRRLGLVLAVLIPVYVVAFYLGNLPFRAISGTALLVAIVWLVIWAWQAYQRVGSLPALAVALGLATFGYGAIIGVVLQVQMASGNQIFPAGADIIGAHAGTMVFSYLILVAMGLIEWQVLDTRGRPKAGLVQLIALFGGGALLALVSLFAADQIQAIGGIYLLVELIAIVLFVVRVMPTALRVDWVNPSAKRHLATSTIFVVVAMAAYIYLVVSFLSSPDQDFETFLPILTASDHATFIGVITNLVFALALTLTADRRTGGSMVEQLVYVLMNGGLVIFIVGLAGQIQVLKQIGAPAMGVGLLIGLAVLAMRLRDSDLRAAETA
jgi:hypothetical protein